MPRLLATWHAWPMAAWPLANPLSAELGVMRTMPAARAGVGRWQAQRRAPAVARLRLFEIGKVFAGQCSEAPRETRRLAAVAMRRRRRPSNGARPPAADFHDIKGDLDSSPAPGGRLTLRLPGPSHAAVGCTRADRRTCIATTRDWAGSGNCTRACSKALDLDTPVHWLSNSTSMPCSRRELPRATAACRRYPSVRRDLAFVVPEERVLGCPGGHRETRRSGEAPARGICGCSTDTSARA
jgi:phenylalanyl-tRNA synthetase beta chain